jgi:peptide/nickel transport system permease protein
MLFSFIAIVTILFLLFRTMPGGPTAAMGSAALSDAVRERVRQQYGLNQPLWVQYIKYWTQLLQGNLGQSYRYGEPVVNMLKIRATNTIAMMFPALVLGYGAATYIGAHAAWLRGTTLERGETVLIMVARATPIFWSSLALLYIFSFELNWFPLGGLRAVGTGYETQAEKFLSLDFLHHLVLPMTAIAIYYGAFPALLMRNNMLEVITEGYIDTARAKGISERRIMLRHAAHNAILPVVTAFTVNIGYALGGQVIVETVFSWPGLGLTMVDAALQSDYPLAQGTFLLLSVMVILLNFFADLIYNYIDPRIKVGMEE